MRKTTEQLMAELQNTKNIDDFVVKNQGEMMDMSLSKYLCLLLEKYQVEKSDVFRRAKMTGSNYGYELFRDDSKKASRDKLIQICLGFPLSIEDAQEVLRYGKVGALYPRDQRDAYVLFALKNGYDVETLNDLLFEHSEKLFE
ncbi:MAG: hypothetical protein IJZ82_12090 [Lachnospiraceae bacterium]|nr:hypothetical protein [Lachnospiraceae bacterium]